MILVLGIGGGSRWEEVDLGVRRRKVVVLKITCSLILRSFVFSGEIRYEVNLV